MALRPRALAAAAAAALVLPLLVGPATTATAHRPGKAACTPFTSPVAVTEGARADQRISGTLCTPRGNLATTVQLLLHGGTYDRGYWTVRGRTGGPSYMEAATAAGHAALAFDQLGSGTSSAPHSSRYTDTTHELVTLQLIRTLRDRGYRKVVLVGHSFGATVARMVAAKHPDAVDGLILTGEGAPPNLASFEAMFGLYMPAGQHPLLAGRRLDDGYLALRTGGKSDWFYHRATTEPRVMLHDELTTEPGVYPADPAYGDVALNRAIRLPVLVVVGQDDKLICGGQGADCTSTATLKAAAAPLYGPRAKLEALAVPATGHSLNVHRTAPLWYAYAQDWTKRRVDGGR
ncbi:alpha/beta hydrolase [Streptomyces albidoflavus]|uniref:Alpha/beta hydrolase n=1 Tax=Streptomyces albidoflavus TaxID=1886 RepID=A0ABY3GZF3_9ACTN|nr:MULTISPECIES: alpha/beta hydrolase [Streptomyces]MYQ73831.1 alpha/beta fold hydrolase [Streptomyces sp. SID4934]PKA38691.1 alpha/beta hydrolase [Streptomyces sp. SM8]RZF09680.1 alpha/beta hydrolase [Streptomyces albidoflavus]TWV25655.1 alpha/beta hydrolase [Streptomyces albidoflavus]SCE31939.1 Pimeloyl-ACP methyl ester carboxylesterase [Streptomyces sp. ScaeMP-6W]